MDPQPRCQWIRRAAAFLARLGVVGLNQIDQCLPGHHRLHHSEKLLTLGLLLSCGQLLIRKAERLATHQSSSGLRSQAHFRADGLGFPEPPWLMLLSDSSDIE